VMKKRRFNWILSDVIRKAATAYYEVSARLRGQRFYCAALHGQSDYNITINADPTVSCNGQGRVGTGHIGDLKKDSFEKIFYGPVAKNFRETLAKGKLPIATCARCGAVKRIAKSKVPREFLDGTSPSAPGARLQTSKPIDAEWPPIRLPYRGMLLENTVNCNIDCLGCDRGSAALIRTQKQMSIENISKMADLVHELGLQQLFYLNLGEPFLSPRIGLELPILRAKN